MQDIVNQNRPSDVEEILDMAPRDFFELNKQIFARLAADHDSRKDDLNEMLIWITFAGRKCVWGNFGSF